MNSQEKSKIQIPGECFDTELGRRGRHLRPLGRADSDCEFRQRTEKCEFYYYVQTYDTRDKIVFFFHPFTPKSASSSPLLSFPTRLRLDCGVSFLQVTR